MVRITVLGAGGRMGRRVVACSPGYPDVKIVGGVEQQGSDAVGRDVGDLAGIGSLGVKVVDSLEEIINDTDVCIDFTSHAASIAILPIIASHGKGHVICSTGFSEEEKAKISKASKNVPILFSPNMSMGVNLLFDLVGEVASKLGPDYNIEIVEAHHNRKKDSPSGTAAKLAEIAAASRGLTMNENGVYGRKGMIGERPVDEIGVHAVRAGDIVGEHTVIFAGPGERIELTHRAHSRDTFANGAIKAAIFLAPRPPGMYVMKDVLTT